MRVHKSHRNNRNKKEFKKEERRYRTTLDFLPGILTTKSICGCKIWLLYS